MWRPNCSVHVEPAGDGVCQEANEYCFASHVFREDGPMVCIYRKFGETRSKYNRKGER